MYKKLTTLFLAFFAIASISFAQSDVSTIKLEQTEGEFNVKALTVSEGTYQFEIANVDVDHPVGFVIAPKGMTDEAHHIKAGYVKEMVETGKASMTGEVKLKKGEYVYFCPLNPTPQYALTVE